MPCREPLEDLMHPDTTAFMAAHHHLTPEPPDTSENPAAPVNGCSHCGVPQRAHAQRWKHPVGWHGWEMPSQEQIKARMYARRAALETKDHT